MNKNTGRFAFLRQLLAAGVTCMFGNPGTSEQSLLDALGDEEFKALKYYLTLHEGSAVAMGDGYARAARLPAVVQLHSYAGLANGLGMMNYARRGYTPMVVLAGEAGLKYEALDGQMAADLVTMARPFVKSDHNGPCAWRAVDSGSLLRLLRRALKAAMTPPAGPVFLALPMDVLDQPNSETVVPVSSVRSAVSPDAETIAEAVKLLAEARRPLILMGDGIAASSAQRELEALAELSGAEVWGVNNSEVNMAASHPLFCGDTGHMFGEISKRITAAADAVLICGTTVMPDVFPALSGVFAADARVIHFDLNTYEIAKNFPVTIGALGDPKLTLRLLAQGLAAILSDQQRAGADDRRKRLKQAKIEQLQTQLARDATTRERAPLRASRFMEELAGRIKDLKEPPLIFDEALTYSPELCRYLPRDEPGSFFQTRAGMLGTGLPGALGLKVARPDRFVFGFSGDGGSMQTIQALSTAARYGIGTKFIVCNNQSYRILKYNLQQYWAERGEPADQPFPDAFDLVQPELRFDKLAEAQGVAAVRVARPQEISSALDRAFADHQPFLIELLLSREL